MVHKPQKVLMRQQPRFPSSRKGNHNQNTTRNILEMTSTAPHQPLLEDESSRSATSTVSKFSSSISSLRDSGVSAEFKQFRNVGIPASNFSSSEIVGRGGGQLIRSNENVQKLTINKLKFDTAGFWGRQDEIDLLEKCWENMMGTQGSSRLARISGVGSIPEEMALSAGHEEAQPQEAPFKEVDDKQPSCPKQLVLLKGYSGVG